MTNRRGQMFYGKLLECMPDACFLVPYYLIGCLAGYPFSSNPNNFEEDRQLRSAPHFFVCICGFKKKEEEKKKTRFEILYVKIKTVICYDGSQTNYLV